MLQSSFSGLQTIKVTFFILLFLFVPPFLSFSPLSPLCVSPLCLPVESPRGGDPNAASRGERFAPTRAQRWWKTKASSVFTGVVYEPIRAIPRQEAVAPSMWAFPAWFWRISGSCAIYVPKRQLDVEKKWGETSAVPIFHLGSPRKTDPTKCQVSFGKLRKKLFFAGLGGVRFPGPSKVANCHSVEDGQK